MRGWGAGVVRSWGDKERNIERRVPNAESGRQHNEFKIKGSC